MVAGTEKGRSHLYSACKSGLTKIAWKGGGGGTVWWLEGIGNCKQHKNKYAKNSGKDGYSSKKI